MFVACGTGNNKQRRVGGGFSGVRITKKHSL